MTASEVINIPGVEVLNHWMLVPVEDGFQWGPNTNGQYSSVDGARMFEFGTDDKELYQQIGGIIVQPPCLTFEGMANSQNGGMIYGVVTHGISSAEEAE